MKIAISGTPGVGKTSVAKKVAEQVGLDYISVNDLAREEGCILSKDQERDTDVVEIDELRGVTSKLEDCVLDGHISHFLDSDKTFVLRCRPSILKKRMKEKGWDQEKIQENVDAEILGVIQGEAFRENDETYVVNTSDRSLDDTVKLISSIIRDEINEGEYSKPISWIERGEV